MPRTVEQLQLFQTSAPPKLKCLTLKQPYAWALFHGKNIENRTWRTNHRGILLIHAAKSCDRRYFDEATLVCLRQTLHVPPREELTFGAIIGAVDVTNCRWGEDESGWGFAQHWHWSITNARQFKEPIPLKGQLGLFDTDLTLQEVTALCS